MIHNLVSYNNFEWLNYVFQGNILPLHILNFIRIVVNDCLVDVAFNANVSIFDLGSHWLSALNHVSVDSLVIILRGLSL